MTASRTSYLFSGNRYIWKDSFISVAPTAALRPPYSHYSYCFKPTIISSMDWASRSLWDSISDKSETSTSKVVTRNDIAFAIIALCSSFIWKQIDRYMVTRWLLYQEPWRQHNVFRTHPTITSLLHPIDVQTEKVIGTMVWMKFYLSICWETAIRYTPLDFTGDKSAWVQIMLLMPSGNKPSPEPMLTQIYFAIWRY